MDYFFDPDGTKAADRARKEAEQQRFGGKRDREDRLDDEENENGSAVSFLHQLDQNITQFTKQITPSFVKRYRTAKVYDVASKTAEL